MTVRKYCLLLHDEKIGKNDKTWFPRWVRRYASTVETVEGKLSITEPEVIRFLETLRDNGTPAWQRLQAVRAVELYRNLVWKTEGPSLAKIRKTLGRLADRERAGSHGSARLGTAKDAELVGCIDPREPAIIQQVRRELRLGGKPWIPRELTSAG